MARACSRDFPWNAAEIHLRPEAALRIPQPRPAMQIIRPYAAKLLFHCFSYFHERLFFANVPPYYSFSIRKLKILKREIILSNDFRPECN
jgi:hypothetical protein